MMSSPRRAIRNDIVKAIFYRYHAIVSIVLKIAMISVIGLHCHDIISLMEGRRIVHSTLSILIRLYEPEQGR
jgi:hypothetical protein